jgi:hypothetical protein
MLVCRSDMERLGGTVDTSMSWRGHSSPSRRSPSPPGSSGGAHHPPHGRSRKVRRVRECLLGNHLAGRLPAPTRCLSALAPPAFSGNRAGNPPALGRPPFGCLVRPGSEALSPASRNGAIAGSPAVADARPPWISSHLLSFQGAGPSARERRMGPSTSRRGKRRRYCIRRLGPPWISDRHLGPVSVVSALPMCVRCASSTGSNAPRAGDMVPAHGHALS